MKVWKTHKGSSIYKILDGKNNSYLLTKENLKVIIDTGESSSYSRLMKKLEFLNINKNTNNHLFLTHSHYDHCHNSANLIENYHCKVWVSAEERAYIRNGFTPLPKGTFLLSKLISYLGMKLPKNYFSYPVFQPMYYIEDDGFLQSEELNIILSPGHTNGSISLIVDDEIALVGDAMFGIFKNSILPPFADDKKAMLQSWEKLLNTNAKIFLPGHGREITRKLLQKEYDKFLRKGFN